MNPPLSRFVDNCLENGGDTERGGFELQINVTNKETPEKARKAPEEYPQKILYNTLYLAGQCATQKGRGNLVPFVF